MLLLVRLNDNSQIIKSILFFVRKHEDCTEVHHAGDDQLERATHCIFTDWSIFSIYTFSFVKELQFRSSDAVTLISFLWLVIARPRESIRPKNKSVYENACDRTVVEFHAPSHRLLIYGILVVNTMIPLSFTLILVAQCVVYFLCLFFRMSWIKMLIPVKILCLPSGTTVLSLVREFLFFSFQTVPSRAQVRYCSCCTVTLIFKKDAGSRNP